MLHPFNQKTPHIHETVFLAHGIHIIGDVSIDEHSSVWYNTLLRGDLAPIVIGKRTNLQDGTIGHVNTDTPLLVGDDVSVGHGCIIHGCQIGNGSLIGMGTILLNGADIGEYALIGAGSLVTEGKKIPPYTLSLGSPAKVIRELTDADLARMQRTTESYVQKGVEYLSSDRRVSKGV